MNMVGGEETKRVNVQLRVKDSRNPKLQPVDILKMTGWPQRRKLGPMDRCPKKTGFNSDCVVQSSQERVVSWKDLASFRVADLV